MTDARRCSNCGAELRAGAPGGHCPQCLLQFGFAASEPPGLPSLSINRWTNSLGQVFVPVPGTEVLFCIWDTRAQDYRAYAQANNGVDGSWENPGFPQGDDHPVVNVSWNNAKAFCAWLTQKDRSEGKISASQSYQLPQETEWNQAVGNTKYPWGEAWPPPSGAGNYAQNLGVDNFKYTSPVGSFAANRYGLYDLGGNVWQWCENEYLPGSGTRVLRGASWVNGDPDRLLASCRRGNAPDACYVGIGFRCVLVVGSTP